MNDLTAGCKIRISVVAAVLCVAATLPGSAIAGGLWLYEVGTDDIGLASAGYGARAQDASTVLTNPAGMTRLAGTQVVAGGQLLYGNASLSLNGVPAGRDAGGGNGGAPFGWIPGAGFFLSHALSPQWSVGFAVAGTFGGSVKYDSQWSGRYYTKESALVGVSLLPSVAYKLNDKVSLGASLNAMYGFLKDTVAVNNIATATDGELRLKDTKWGWGANLGLLYEASPQTRWGLVYNSRVSLNFSPQAEFSGIHPALNAVLNARGLNGATVNMNVKVPQGLMGSVSHQLDDRWTLLGSVGWQDWSRFGKVEAGIESSNPTATTANLNFKDTWHGALGAQYKPGGAWQFNFGTAYDSAFQDRNNVSPGLPTNAAWRFGVGARKEESKTFSWGFALEYLYGGTTSLSRTSSLPVALGGRGDLSGSYRNQDMYFFSANLGWKL